MDQDETALSSLNRESFHDLKGIKNNRKEITGNRSYTEARPRAQYRQAWAKSRTSWDQNSRRGSYVRKPVAGVSHEFRVVRDNRSNQKTNTDVIQESIQNSSEDNYQVKSYVSEKSSGKDLSDQKNSVASTDGRKQCLNSEKLTVPSRSIDVKSSSIEDPSPSDEVVNNYEANYTSSASANSPTGVYSSSLDPVHVPSAGIVGAIRREVGVVGVRRWSSDRTAGHASVSSNPFAIPPLEKGDSLPIARFGQCATTSKRNHSNSFLPSENSALSMPVSSSFASSHFSVKPHQQVGHQKAKHPSVEWKPKPSQKYNTDGHIATTITSVASSDVSSARSSQMQMAELSEKISQVHVSRDEQVIIPHHLQVPESERTKLTFGSFGAGFDSTKGFPSAPQAFGIIEDSNHETSSSIPTSAPVGLSKDSAAGLSDLVNSLARTTSDSPASAAELDQPLAVISESVSPRDIESYPEVGVVQGYSPSYNSPKSHQLQNPTNLPSFSAYEPQMRFGIPFSGAMIDHCAHGKSFSSASEALSTHVANCTSVSSIPIVQQQPQQQPLTQFYPQVHISHYANFLPYHQTYSPVYVPPMAAIPKYPNNPSYPHSSNGNNYFLMPAGSSHITTSGTKFAASQYKSIHSGGPATGFMSYTNPGGYSAGTPRAVGSASGFEDIGRIKDGNLYVQNPQAETTDIWIQTPTELTGLQSTPYYSLPAQALSAPTAHPSFPPSANSSFQSFNGAAVAAQSPHVQYAGLYHPSQPGPISGPVHHLAHQQALQGLGANVGMGAPVAAATPAAQVANFGWNY